MTVWRFEVAYTAAGPDFDFRKSPSGGPARHGSKRQLEIETLVTGRTRGFKPVRTVKKLQRGLLQQPLSTGGGNGPNLLFVCGLTGKPFAHCRKNRRYTLRSRKG